MTAATHLANGRHTCWSIKAMLVAVALVGCGGNTVGPPLVTTPGGPGQPVEPFIPVAPRLLVASPNALAVGDDMTILGESFIKPIHGRVWVQFSGTFIDDQGQASPVEHRSEAQFLNQSKVQWSLWPDIVFAPTRDRLGRFVGAVSVINQAADGSELPSEQMPVAIDIQPSLIPRVLQPRAQGCAAIVQRTRENTPMIFSVEAIGLRAGTNDAPLVFNWTFLSRQWDVVFDNSVIDTSSIVADNNGAVVVEDRVTSGLSSTVSDASQVNFFIKVKNDLMGVHRLSQLRTKAIEANGSSMPISVAVSAVDGGGKRAKVALRLTLGKAIDMIYDGGSVLAERLQPVQVTDCIPGGDIGRDVSYHETSSESRHRSMSHSYNANMGMRLGLPSNPWILGLDPSVGFGVNVNESVSSDRSTSLNISGHIMPGMYAAFYRQTSKILRVAQLIGYSMCGEPAPLGEVVLTDWVFTPHMATGQSCVPPPTELPPAQKFIYDDE